MANERQADFIPDEPASDAAHADPVEAASARSADAASTGRGAAANGRAEAGADVAQEAGEQGAQAAEGGRPAEAARDPRRQWYVIHTYAGYENKVKANIEKHVRTMGMQDKIFEVLVPTEEAIEVKDGKRRTVQRKVFPGYVLVEMIMTDESWYVVRNTPGVTGFVGAGNKPTPLLPSEVEQIRRQMGVDEPRPLIRFEVGESVKVTEGPFEGFIGQVESIDHQKGKLRVLVSMFGRETPVELDFTQVEKI
ncbi:transcription termination/antitermination protein NusG [Thermaerobacter sp. FW80]|nr:transcription termination/antitermination protein NusG [Thermaerobacter sp. FW80]